MSNTNSASAAPLEPPVRALVERLMEEADLCRNEGAVDIAALLTEAWQALEFYRSTAARQVPRWVPMAIWLPNAVRGDYPIAHKAVAEAGHHECNSNAWGAISVMTPHGALGIKPSEYYPTRWRRNES
jgi:hypothetical protein